MDFDERIWYKVFRCPKCGYKTTVTNVCRQCRKMPTTEELIRPMWCYWHKCYHFHGIDLIEPTIEQFKTLIPTTHKSIMMEETEWASRFNPKLMRNERRKVKNLPEGAILK